MAAQSGKLFQEILCESRSHPVESTDPVAAKTIDDLKKQVSRQRAEIEAERVKLRELQRSHEKEIRMVREDLEKERDRSLEALSCRKDNEKVAEVAQVKERLIKQNQHELRTQRGDLEDEMRRLERRLTKEREETMRKVLNLERQKTEEEAAHHMLEDTVMTREEHLKAEIFRLGEDVERLEFQVSNLRRENREQINIIKKVTHEHKMEIEALIKSNQVEAARDQAKIKLAEQIIQEKERHIQDEEYRVDIALMEKEALAEELVNLRSRKTLDLVSRDEGVMSPTTGKRVSMPGGGGGLQRRVEELEAALRKLDEERQQLKQENASLRKTAVKEGGEGDGKAAEEKLKRLRKRNAELVAQTRQLDDKTKSLKLENEQLQKLAASSSGGVVGGVSGSVGGGEKGKGGGGEGDVRRSQSRQYAKDISEYTKQILAKDRELDSLRKKLAQYEVDGKALYEPAPEMETRLRSMAMERLKMEKVMVQLYSKVSNPLDVGVVTKQEMESESKEMERLFDDNKSLRDQLELLKSQARMEEVDHSSVPAESVRDRPPKKRALSAQLVGVGGVSERERELMEENTQLQARISGLVKCEDEVCKLESALKEVESAKTSYEQQNRRLTKQLSDTQQLAQEMDAVQEMSLALEKEVVEFKRQLSNRDAKISELEEKYQTASESLGDVTQEAHSLRGKVTDLEVVLKKKQDEIRQLASELDQQQEAATHCQPPSSSSLPPACSVSLQTSFTPSPEKQTPGNTSKFVSPQSDTQQAPSSSNTQPPPPCSSSTSAAGDRRVKISDHPSSVGERRVKSAGKPRRIKSPVKRAGVASGSGVTDAADTSLDNEIRVAGYDMTDPYDSSEGVTFSDTNLDGSSMLSLDEEGTRGYAAGVGEGGVSTVPPPTSGVNEFHPLGWVERESERITETAPTENRAANDLLGGNFLASDQKMGDTVTESGAVRSCLSHDITGKSHDVTRESATTVQDREEGCAGQRQEEGEETTGGGEKFFTDVVIQRRGEKEGEGGCEEGEGCVRMIDLETLAEADSSEENMSSSSNSETDLLTQKSKGVVDSSQEPGHLTSDPMTSDRASNAVSVYIAKFTYNPAKMSPNPNYHQELSITAGDYLYVFGEMDADGFYFSQLVTGERGLVPSNFVEKVAEGDGDHSLPRLSHVGPRSRRVSDLQDIPELDEDVSSSSTMTESSGIPPPVDLELERQFVEDGMYSVVIQWSSPPSLPQTILSTSDLTYNVYVNRQFKEAVPATPGVMTAHLREIPRQELVTISVRTVTEEGESSDPAKTIVLNPHYPEPPTDVRVSLSEEPPSSSAIVVQWTPSRPHEMSAPISGYVILLNSCPVMQLQSDKVSSDTVFARLVPSDLNSLTLLPEERIVLTVRTVSDRYHSQDSVPIVVARELFDRVMMGSDRSRKADSVSSREALESSHDSVTSSDECRGRETLPAQLVTNTQNTSEHHMMPTGDYVTCNNSHMISDVGQVHDITSNGVETHINGSAEPVNGVVSETREEVDGGREAIRGEPRYYLATFSYNPAFHSPNEDSAEDELTFREGDIITATSEVDEEGFFEGMLRGKKGLVPSNMVELVIDPDKLKEIPEILAKQQCRSPDPLSRLSTVNGGGPSGASCTMRAIYGYDPATDSPNENKEDELCIQEGDIVTVFGRPDEDGYYQGELKGKRGLVPSNFLELVSEEQMEGEERGRAGSMGMEIFAASEEDMEQAKRFIAEVNKPPGASDSLKRSEKRSNSLSDGSSTKQKKGILSKGRNLFSKGTEKK